MNGCPYVSRAKHLQAFAKFCVRALQECFKGYTWEANKAPGVGQAFVGLVNPAHLSRAVTLFSLVTEVWSAYDRIRTFNFLKPESSANSVFPLPGNEEAYRDRDEKEKDSTAIQLLAHFGATNEDNCLQHRPKSYAKLAGAIIGYDGAKAEAFEVLVSEYFPEADDFLRIAMIAQGPTAFDFSLYEFDE